MPSLVGAVPLTGVVIRSATNVAAGGRTRLYAILHGVWLLILVAAAPFILRLVPTASLAAELDPVDGLEALIRDRAGVAGK